MAKVKTFAVEVEIVLKRTVFVDARRPNGATARLEDAAGWSEAVRYQEDEALHDVHSLKDANVTVTRVREAGF
jgi:hypothetical protein